MNILLACQRSGYLRELLRSAGHNAYTCDLEPAEDGTHRAHYIGDVLGIMRATEGYWHCLIAMPPCDYLSSSGQHWNGKPGQRTQLDVNISAEFFMTLARAPIKHKCIENSVGIMSRLWRKPDQIVQPWWFGDDASKRTCLWMHDFPLLRFTLDTVVPPRLIEGKPRWANQTDSGQNRLAPSPTRSADRARTYPGIARALFDAVQKIPSPEQPEGGQ